MFVKLLKWLFLAFGFCLLSFNEDENVMSLTTNETAFFERAGEM